MTDGPLSLHLTLKKDRAGRVGAERMRLLSAVREAGSISGAARLLGVTYKTAWDGVDALNNLFQRPLVSSRTGGDKGGGAQLTGDGETVLSAFAAVQEELDRFSRTLARHFDQDDRTDADLIMRSFVMKTSARNALHGTVIDIRPGAVNAEVELALTDRVTLSAIVTNRSVTELGLTAGRGAVALIKSSFVLLAAGDPPLPVSARNQIAGTVIRLQEGAVNTEYVLDIGGGKTLAAIITRESADGLTLRPGDRATALIKASHIILGVD